MNKTCGFSSAHILGTSDVNSVLPNDPKNSNDSFAISLSKTNLFPSTHDFPPLNAK
ncbi:hypothetical protein [Clostridium tertium]|uniref:hypothetical protein n=1 Tax=Clostridium tertium TaxID=1559 RepID=UPI002029073F|nr:hypothetical protein [Clostridium tertium]